MIEYMGTAISSLDRQINSYLPQLNTQQKKAVLSVVKSYVVPLQENEPEDDKAYVAEMDRRFKEMESGKVKLYTLDEVEAHARESYNSTKRKK
jgi:pantothenate synthetase